MRPQDRGQRGHLGLAVEVPQLDVGQPLLQLAQHLHRHRRRAVVALAQAAQVGAVEVGVPQQRDPDGRRAEQLRDLLAGDRREDRRGVGGGQDDARRAEVDVDGEEAVELRAVVHRERVHLDVVGAHAAVDHAAHVLADQRPAGEHDALGAGLGAGRVHQPERVVVGDRDVRRAPVARPPPVVDVLPAGCRRGTGQPDPAPDAAVHAGGGQRLLRRRRQRVLAHHPGGAGVPEDERDLVRPQHEVDRHQDHAELGGGEREHRVLPGVVAEQRQPVALRQPARGEGVRRAVRRRLELRVREPEVTGDDGELVRVPGGRPAQQVADGVLPGLRDRGAGLGAEHRVHERVAFPGRWRKASWRSAR